VDARPHPVRSNSFATLGLALGLTSVGIGVVGCATAFLPLYLVYLLQPLHLLAPLVGLFAVGLSLCTLIAIRLRGEKREGAAIGGVLAGFAGFGLAAR